MKFLLIQANSPSVSDAVPLGLAYIASVLKKNKCEVKVIDCTAPYADYSDEDIINVARSYDIIGFLLMTTHVKRSYGLIEKLKPLNKIIIAGGPHATIMPEEVLDHGVDIVFRDESEASIEEFVKKKKLEIIKGISYRNNEKIIHNPKREYIKNLDVLPFPAKELFNSRDFARSEKELKNAMSTVVSSRGCPGRCVFCSKTVSGSRYRFRSAENLLNEILETKKKYGVDSFLIVDDTLNIHKERFVKLCKLLKENNISWRCNARIDFVDEEMLKIMKESGCTFITWGMESGDPEIQKKIKKNLDLEKVRKIVKLTHQLGISQTVNLMFGFPFESAENIQNTINLLKELEPYYENVQRGGILIPFPGTELYEEYKNKYGFEKWWLKIDKYLKVVHEDNIRPLYKRIFFDDLGLLKNQFFIYSPKVKRKIKKAIRIINAIVIKKRAEKLNSTHLKPTTWVIQAGIYFIFYLSKLFYFISPYLERKIVQGFYFSARRSKLYH